MGEIGGGGGAIGGGGRGRGQRQPSSPSRSLTHPERSCARGAGINPYTSMTASELGAGGRHAGGHECWRIGRRG